MKQLITFSKKEFLEVIRNGKFLILVIVFVLFGIMNPAIAKLTPWIMEQYSSSLEESGIIITEVTVDALTSWTQFYKNIPMGLIVFLLMFSGIMANELQKGTLINVITKGMSRRLVVISKSIVMIALWTLNYWMCYFITYVYNEYFWDNKIGKHVLYAAFLVYVLGIWLISLMILMSTIFTTGSAVAVGTGAVFFVSYMLSIVPDLKKYLPSSLINAGELLGGIVDADNYNWCLGIVVVLTIVQMIVAVKIFDKKSI